MTPTASGTYTIKEDVVYTITIEEFKAEKWVAYNGQDIQMEFVRIDPFIRQTMKNKNRKFEAKFKISDVYGVYHFNMDYIFVKTGLLGLFHVKCHLLIGC